MYNTPATSAASGPVDITPRLRPHIQSKEYVRSDMISLVPRPLPLFGRGLGTRLDMHLLSAA